MTPKAQGHWFDYEAGRALRIREETQDGTSRVIITSKQLLNPGDHSAMTNIEDPLTVHGMHRVLSSMDGEFADAITLLEQKPADDSLSFADAKQLIEQSGRKEYITLEKQRKVYRSEVTTDIDAIPALQATALGFWASVEIEYTGDKSLVYARERVQTISHELGYNKKDVLERALPGLAIPYLARF